MFSYRNNKQFTKCKALFQTEARSVYYVTSYIEYHKKWLYGIGINFKIYTEKSFSNQLVFNQNEAQLIKGVY